jgi:hypothetical protein
MAMGNTTFCTLLVAAVAAAGCARSEVEPDQGPTTVAPRSERPAPPHMFIVMTNAGAQLTGAAARIDIRHANPPQPPDVEISISATSGSGATWSALTAAPPEFLETLSLTARVVDGRVVPGTATVQAGRANAEAGAAPAGLMSLRLYDGRLMGEASRMDDEHAARFDGPFIVTCAVPAAVGSIDAPAPSADGPPPTLIVDEAFESAPCRPYAALGGWSRRVQR